LGHTLEAAGAVLLRTDEIALPRRLTLYLFAQRLECGA